MLRTDLNESLKTALREKNTRAAATIRLILAALKDRDICARGKGNPDGIAEEEILGMLQSMIKQRRESIKLYEEGGRCDLAERENEEIEVIQGFMPAQLSADEIESAVGDIITDVGASNLKDMGKVMAALKGKFSGRMDFSRASAVVRAQLG